MANPIMSTGGLTLPGETSQSNILNKYREMLLKRAKFSPEQYASNRVLNSANQAKDTMAGGLSGGYDASLGAGNLQKQRSFADSLYGQLTGGIPSLAEQQYKQGLEAQNNAKTGLVASQRLGGGQLAASRRALANQGADQGQIANRDLGQLRAQERMSNEDLFTNYANQIRQQSASQAELKNRLVAEAMARMSAGDISKIGLDTGTNLNDIRSEALSQQRQQDFMNKIIGAGVGLGSGLLGSFAYGRSSNTGSGLPAPQFSGYNFGQYSGSSYSNPTVGNSYSGSLGSMPNFNVGEY